MKIISGFTLIELMVTIAILAIIAIMAAPSMAHLLNSSKVNSEARNFAMALAETRSNAVLTNKATTLHLSTEDPRNASNGVAVTDFYWSPGPDVTFTSIHKEIVYLPSGVIKGATTDLNFNFCVKGVGSDVSFTNQGSLKLITQGNCI